MKPFAREVASWQNGSFEKIFEQYWDQVWNIAWRMVGDADEAEDLAIEAFLKLHQARLAEHDNVAGWLYRVTTRLGLNILRSKRRQVYYETLAEYPASFSSRNAGAEEVYEARIERERVRQTLGKMKPRSAQILILHSAGFSYGEIAEITAIKPASVGKLLARARNEFEKVWRKMEHL